MSKFKKLGILLALLILVSAAAFGVTRYEEKQEEIRSSNDTILSIDPETVTALSWEYEDTSLSFHRDSDWSYDEDDAFPVSEDTIDQLLETFRSFDVAFTIDQVSDFGQYGLDDPACRISLTADGQDYELLLGDYSTLDSERYVSIGDGKVYLAVSDPMDTFEVQLSDMILNDDIPDVFNADQVVFSGSVDYTITCEEDSDRSWCAEDIYFTDEGPLDTTEVHSYLTSLSYVPLTDYASYNVTEEELAAWGLDDPELTVTVTYTPETGSEAADGAEESSAAEETADPVTFTVSIGRNREELAAWEADEAEKAEKAEKAESEAADAAEADDEADTEDAEDAEELTVTAYIRLNDSPIVYILSDSSYQSLTEASYNDLRHDELMTASFSDITQIDISLDDEIYTINSELVETESEDSEEDEEDTDEVQYTRIWHYTDTEALDISALQQSVSSLTAASFTEEAPTDQEEVCITFYLDNEAFPQITLALYRYDNTYCLAAVNGESIALVSRSDVVDLIESVYAIVLPQTETGGTNE